MAPRFAPALLAVLGLLAFAGPARGEAVDPRRPIDSEPQLLLIHGGSFLFEDPFFEAQTDLPARVAGFNPHYLAYPLGDLRGAVTAARTAVAELRQSYGPSVYAYGSSAGGTLATLLAGDGLVAAAAAKAPPTDLVGWEWPLGVYGPDYYEQIGADTAARYRLSPLRRSARRPLLVVQGRLDRVVPLTMSEAYDAKFARVHLWAVPGGHHTERVRPWVLERTLGWLGDIAHTEAS